MVISFDAMLLAAFGPPILMFVILPTALLFAAYLIYIIVMTLKELWKND